MRFFLLSFLALLLLPVAAQAQTEGCRPKPGDKNCLNDVCGMVGESMIDSDETNIIACLYTDASKSSKIWKSIMGSSGGSAYPKGRALLAFDDPASYHCAARTDAVGNVYLSNTYAYPNNWSGFARTEILVKPGQHQNDGFMEYSTAYGIEICTVSPEGLSFTKITKTGNVVSQFKRW